MKKLPKVLMKKLPKVLIHLIYTYFSKNDIYNISILSKKIHTRILKYKLEHFYFNGPLIYDNQIKKYIFEKYNKYF